MSILRPNRRKNRKRDGDYMEFIARRRCVACHQAMRLQISRTEVAHVGDRGLGQKCPDRETIPLCVYHHREGPDAAHKLGKRFWERHGLDRDALIKTLQEAYWRTREQ